VPNREPRMDDMANEIKGSSVIYLRDKLSDFDFLEGFLRQLIIR